MAVIEISDIMNINLQIHETHSGVIAGQAEVHFDVIGGINVAWCKNLFVHEVAHNARQGILVDLLYVLRQSLLIRTQLIAVRPQDRFQSLLAQAVLGSRVKEDATMRLVSRLFNWHARAVHHHCVQGESLAQGKLGVEHFSSIVVSGFGRNARGQIQITHRHDTVNKADKTLTVSFAS